MSDFINGLDQFVKDRLPKTIYLAKVTSVNDDGPWCHAEDADGNKYFEIKLQPALLNGSETYIIPKVNSWIVIGSLRGKEKYVCLQIGEIDYLNMVAGQSTFQLKDDGFVIKRAGESLAGLIGEMLDAMVALTVTCAAPGSPSSPPINLATFSTLKTRFQALLKTS